MKMVSICTWNAKFYCVALPQMKYLSSLWENCLSNFWHKNHCRLQLQLKEDCWLLAVCLSGLEAGQLSSHHIWERFMLPEWAPVWCSVNGIFKLSSFPDFPWLQYMLLSLLRNMLVLGILNKHSSRHSSQSLLFLAKSSVTASHMILLFLNCDGKNEDLK